MKKIIIILVLLPIISFGQILTNKNRFAKEFKDADAEFERINTINSAKVLDSIYGVPMKPFFYESIWERYKLSDREIIISESDLLGLYMNGYMAGQQSFNYKNDFDYEYLYYKLKKIKKELKRRKRYEK